MSEGQKSKKEEALGRVVLIDNIFAKSRTDISPKEVKFSGGLYGLIKGKRILSLTHKNDMDGMASAAMLRRYYGIDLEDIAFVTYSKENYESVADWLSRKGIRNSVVVLSDIGISPESAPQLASAIVQLKGKGNILLWFDHHVWSNEQIDFYAKAFDYMIVGENRLMCGTELVYYVLCSSMDHDGKGKELADLVHLIDFAIIDKSKEDLMNRLSSIVSYIFDHENAEENLRKMVDLVAKLDFDNRFIVETYENYKREEEKNAEELLKNSYLFQVGKYRVAVGFGEGLQSTAACMSLMQRHNADIGVFVRTRSGRCSMRSAREEINTVPLANMLGGNGHPQASGFSLDLKGFSGFDEKGKAKALERIIESARKVFE